jgi:hypothetical protein
VDGARLEPERAARLGANRRRAASRKSSARWRRFGWTRRKVARPAEGAARGEDVALGRERGDECAVVARARTLGLDEEASDARLRG